MRCAKCGGTEFYGTQPSSCKECAKARATARYRAKREEIVAAKRAAYVPQPRPRMPEAERKRRLRARKRSWARRNPEKVRAMKRASYLRNRDTAVAYQQARSPEQRAAAVERTRRWAQANPDRARENHRRKQLNRRARKRAGFVEEVDPGRVYEMHGGRCGICGLFIDGDFHVDHVTPLSRGGQHGYINVQPAHPRCNSSKGAKVAA